MKVEKVFRDGAGTNGAPVDSFSIQGCVRVGWCTWLLGLLYSVHGSLLCWTATHGLYWLGYVCWLAFSMTFGLFVSRAYGVGLSRAKGKGEAIGSWDDAHFVYLRGCWPRSCANIFPRRGTSFLATLCCRRGLIGSKLKGHFPPSYSLQLYELSKLRHFVTRSFFIHFPQGPSKVLYINFTNSHDGQKAPSHFARHISNALKSTDIVPL